MPSTTRARRSAWDRALLVAGVAAIAGLAQRHMDLLGDAFWYVASGRWVLAHGLPHADPFSFASDGERWIVGMPGSCVLFALVADHLGLRALQAMGTIVEATAIGLLWLGSSRTRAGRTALLFPALLFIQASAADLSVRGQLFGDLAFVLFLAALRRLRDGRRVSAPWFVLAIAVWANLHYSFLLAFFVPVGAAALLVLEPRSTRPAIGPLLRLVPLAALGSLINPYGARYLPFTLGMMFSPITDDFDFFRSPDFHDPVVVAALLVGVAALVLRGRFGRARCRLPEQALVVVFLAAACNSRRWEPLLVAVSMGVAGPALDRVLVRRRALGRREALAVGGIVAVLAALGVVGGLSGPNPFQDVPVRAAEVARTVQRQRAAAGRATDQVVDPLHWGGYLAYAWNGDPKYFHDGRDQTRLFANGVYEDSKVLRRGEPGALRLLDVYEAGVVLWERGGPLDASLRTAPGWRLAYEDWIAVVYTRSP